ncbi:MAG: hypothetical protein WA441_01415 [Methyloceanibacter sp.]
MSQKSSLPQSAKSVSDELGLSALSIYGFQVPVILLLAAIPLILVGASFVVPFGVPFFPGLPMIGIGLEAVAGGLLLFCHS